MVKKVTVIAILSTLILSGLMASSAYAGLGYDCSQIDSSFTASVDPTTAAPGDSVTVSVSGTLPGSQVLAYLDEESNQIAFFTTNGSGNGSASGIIPAGTTPGQHYLRYAGMDENENEINCFILITITENENIVLTPPAEPGATVQQDGYTQAAATRSTLPSTGIWLIPVAGLVGAGALVLGTRRY